MGESEDAEIINKAVNKFIASGGALTPDMKGKGTTASVTEGILKFMKK